jgi:hypothetical protein
MPRRQPGDNGAELLISSTDRKFQFGPCGAVI